MEFENGGLYSLLGLIECNIIKPKPLTVEIIEDLIKQLTDEQ